MMIIWLSVGPPVYITFPSFFSVMVTFSEKYTLSKIDIWAPYSVHVSEMTIISPSFILPFEIRQIFLQSDVTL